MTKLLERLFGPVEPMRGDWAESEYLGNADPNGRRRFPMQPLNTLSNVGYGAAGIVLWYMGAPVLAVALGVLMIGSGLYHGWPTGRTNRVDHFGMQATFMALLGYTAALPDVKIAGLALAAGAVGAWRRPDAVLTLSGLIGVVLWLQYDPGLPPLGVLALLLGVLSMGAWVMDRNRNPWVGSVGHVVFHVGTAAAILAMGIGVLT